MESNLLLPFLHATRDVLLSQCGLQASFADPRPIHEREGETDVVAGTCFTTPNHMGSMLICLPLKVYLHLLGKLTGKKAEALTDEGKDGAIELVNIVMSQVKRKAAERGYAVERTGPIFAVWGSEIDSRYLNVGETLSIPCGSPAGNFSLELSIEPRKP